jgi:hypothetical protein
LFKARSLAMNSGKVALTGLIVAVLVAFGAFTAATPSSVSAEVTSVLCDGAGPGTGLTLDAGELVECEIQLTSDEADLRITSSAFNPVEITSPTLADVSPAPWDIVSSTALQALDPDSDVEAVEIVFEYKCVEAVNDIVLVVQVGGPLATEVVNFPIRCLGGLDLITPDTAIHGVVENLVVLAHDDTGILFIDLIDPGTGALTVAATSIGGGLAPCPASEAGPRRVQVDTDKCDADTVPQGLNVVVIWVPDCSTGTEDVRIGAKRMGSEDIETVACSPAVQLTVTVPEIKPPSTGNAGLASSSESNASPFVIPAAAATVLAGVAGLRFMRR